MYDEKICNFYANEVHLGVTIVPFVANKIKEENKEIEIKINEVLDKIRPYLENDGGSVKFNRYENGIVYVTLIGACAGCPMAASTLEDGIETALVNEIPEVIKVINEN